MALTLWIPLASHVYLFTTHITRNKIIAGVGVLIVLVAALGVWLYMRRRNSARQA